jgi:hypothetical protein
MVFSNFSKNELHVARATFMVFGSGKTNTYQKQISVKTLVAEFFFL